MGSICCGSASKGCGITEVQNPAHLRFRVAARPGVSHGQGGGNAVRGKEEVARLASELRVKIKGKSGVVLNQRSGWGSLHIRRQSDTEQNPEQREQK
jgi:hypothetical protein